MSSRLPVHEEFLSLQGEGRHSGMAAWFVRLAGCDVGCPWCDSAGAWDERGATFADVAEIAARAKASGAPAVVITGGEPLMHNLDNLTDTLHASGLSVHLETSGTHPPSGRFDWVCLSPKRHRPPLQAALDAADELKVVVASPDDLAWAAENAALVGAGCLLYLQPEWNSRATATPLIVDYVERNPHWRLSLQAHKYIDIP
jgi:organic radical activating enzyme